MAFSYSRSKEERIALPHPICYGGANSWPWAQSHFVPSLVQSLFGYGLVLCTVTRLCQCGAAALALPQAQAVGFAAREIMVTYKEKLFYGEVGQILCCPERLWDLHPWRCSGLNWA